MKKMMKKFFIIIGLISTSFAIFFTSCKKESFDEFYRDPSTTTETTIDKQFAGITYDFRELIFPSYWNYFVILRTTANRYIQAVGWQNEPNQLLPGAAAVQDRWATYYKGLAQYKEFERVYASEPEEEQGQSRIYYLAAKILFYDQTQQMVDLYGNIPWSKAGALNANPTDYTLSYAAYDKGEDIYTAMLDDLKAISTELNALTVPSVVMTKFRTQDIINGGSLDLWKRYCNSLRLRMLTRISDASSFSSRAQSELAEIVGEPSTYPLVMTNDHNIQLDIFDNTNEWYHSRGFRDGIESWNANLAGKAMIDYMVDKADPRLPFMFEKGALSPDTYVGLDPALTTGAQQQLINGNSDGESILSIYNRSTYSRNQNFPGVIISASEVNFLLAEYHARNSGDALANDLFETGIRESISMLQQIRQDSNNDDAEAPAAPTSAAIDAYIANVGWTGNKIELIARQKWLHFNIIQPLESWAEVRRLNYPTFTFRVEPADLQKEVPNRWMLPSSEVTYNTEHYNAVRDQDNVNNKLFWDVN